MQGINWGLSWNSNWKLWTRVWGSPFLRDLCPISLHDIHYSYLSYCGRATSCTQVSFNSRPELIIESYELYISTSEPTSARNSKEVSRVVSGVDEQLTHCSLSLTWYENTMMESKVVYHLQKYSWKEPVSRTPDNFSRNFSGKCPGATGCLKRFFCFSDHVSFLQSRLWYQFKAFAAAFR